MTATADSGIKNNDDDDSLTFVRLNEFEDGFVKNGSSAIATITWCSGNIETVAALLWKERLCEIVKANPWLAGRIVHNQQRGTEKGNFLEYKSTGITTKEIEPLFRRLTADDAFLSPQTPYEDLGRKCADANLLLPYKFDATKPLFQVIVIPSNSNDSTFAIIVTMSHVAGDGDTYYSIFNMLLGGSPIKALDVKRVDHQLLKQYEVLGKQECGLLHSAGFIWTAIRGLFVSKVLGLFSKQYRSTSLTFLVDADKLKALKEKEVGSDDDGTKVDFVSTNDIITSWFLRNSACQHGMMAINLRGRIENYDKDKAGNYENLLYYHIPEDCRTPALIRRSLSPLKRVVTPDRLPSTGELAGGDFAIATSWASFHGAALQLGGDCQQLAHVPIYDLQGAPASISMCIIFRYAPTQLAVMVFGTPLHLEGFKDAPFASSEERNIYHF